MEGVRGEGCGGGGVKFWLIEKVLRQKNKARFLRNDFKSKKLNIRIHAFLFIRIYFIRILKMKWDKKLRIS